MSVTSNKEVMFFLPFVCLSVCLSVCLFVCKITQKFMDRFWWNFQDIIQMWKERTDLILGSLTKRRNMAEIPALSWVLF